MKKTIIILMVVCLLASVVSCGKKPDDEKPKVTENATSQNTKSPEKETPKQAEETEKPAIELDCPEFISAEVNGKRNMFYIDYCSKRYRHTHCLWSELFHASGINFVAVQYYDESDPDASGSFTGLFTEVFDFLNNGHAFSDMQVYTFGKSFAKDTKIVPNIREISKINGIDAERFEGIAGEDGKTYVYGYSFIFNEIPCMLFGIIVDIDENQDLKELQKQEIDMMMQTVRLDVWAE